jgi:hypothetical protein
VANVVLLALALWVVSHTVATEIPLTANAPKPLSCQLCLSGWICLVMAVISLARGFGPWATIAALAVWALSVLIEAVYNRLQTIIL